MQYISDLHLRDQHNQIRDDILSNRGSSKYLALLGDIGDPMQNIYRDLIHDLAPHYQEIFVVAGNHEYYSGHDMGQIDQKISEICRSAPGQVHFMNNTVKRLDREGVAVIGTTLWSKISERYEQKIVRRVADYHKIKIRDGAIRDDDQLRKFTPNDSNTLHEQALTFIRDSISLSDDIDKVIVLSHHAPISHDALAPQHQDSNINSAFVNDLDDFLRAPIRIWLFGHTHWQTNYTMRGYGLPSEGVQIASNPLGYGEELKRNGQSVNWGAHVQI